MRIKKLVLMLPVLLSPITLIGCGCSDDRYTNLAIESARRQADQNQEMARLNREVAEGTKRLVAANAETADKFQTMQAKIHTQQSQLEAERQSIAQQRLQESILGPILTDLGMLAVCALPLVLCWQLLRCLGGNDLEMTATELLIEQWECKPNPVVSDGQEKLPAEADAPRLSAGSAAIDAPLGE